MILLALGGAGGVWDELEEARSIYPDADVGAVNEAGRDYTGTLTAWATLHVDKFHPWQRHREQKGLNTDYIAVSNKGHPLPRVDRVERELWSGTSGLYLCQVAILTLGYDLVICCGMPLTDTPHYFDSGKWWAAPNYRRGWKEAVNHIGPKIRSMSGWTRDLVGHP